MNKAIGDKLKQEVKDFLKKHPILYTPEHEKYKQEAEIFLPQFFDKVKDIIQELPFPLKQYHTMLRDNAKKLFIDKAKINAEDAQNEANKFIITPLFLRIIAPMITLENATGTSALLQNLANQITQNIKPNQWSFFTSTINQMQMDGKYSAYLGVLLA
jgi:hypothetical protein